MGKPFEINYAPDQWQNEYVGAFPTYGGVNVALPENIIPPRYSPSANDVVLKNAEVRSRPTLYTTTVLAPPAGIGKILGIGVAPTTALNASLVLFSTAGVYAFWSSAWHQLTGSAAVLQANTPVAWRLFGNVLYFTNGNQHLSSWDGVGIGTMVVDNATVGGIHVGAYYLDIIDNHIILLNTNEGGTRFANRIRWSANGLPAVWDPAVNINAGFNDFLEVADYITGTMMQGRVGYIYRTQGVIEIAPTGQGIVPFAFNHLWSSQNGVGNFLPFAASQYGNVGTFISANDIYMLEGSTITPIGGVARDAIFNDLYLSTNLTNARPVMTAVVPGLEGLIPTVNPVFAPYLNLSLYIFIEQNPPIGEGTIVWSYSFEDKNWVRWLLPNFTVTGTSTYYNGALSFTGGMYMPGVPDLSGSDGLVGTFAGQDSNNALKFDDPNQGSTYNYRIEDVEPNRVPTVRRVVVTYRDLGAATITITVTGTNDNAQAVSAAQTVAIGGNADNKLYTKFVDLTLSAFRPQLSWSRAAGAGPVAIARMVMVGTSEEITL